MPEFEAHITIAVRINGARNTEHARRAAERIGERLSGLRAGDHGTVSEGIGVKQILVNDIDFAKSR
jgi:hypothetical protein